MTYKKRFGNYEIRFDEDGMSWKWFKTLTNAVAEFDELAEAADEFEDECDHLCLVDLKTGEIIKSVATH